MLTTAIKEGTCTLPQTRESKTASMDQDVVNDLANSFYASNDLVHATIIYHFEMLLIPNAARLHT